MDNCEVVDREEVCVGYLNSVFEEISFVPLELDLCGVKVEGKW